MNHFNPTSTLATEHIDKTAAAYKLAGLTPPNQAHRITELIGAIPNYGEELHAVAREAIATDDPEKFLEEAIGRVQRAKAAEELHHALGRVIGAVELETAPERIDRTAEDLAPFLTRTVKALTQAAKKLDPTDPLSVDNAVRDDTTKELKTVQATLTTLARILETYPSQQDHRVPHQIMRILPIITIPDVGPERYTPAHGYSPIVTDEHTATRIGLQRLVRTIDDNPDLAIIRIAEGHYPNITFQLANSTELAARIEAAANAHRRIAEGKTDAGYIAR